MKTLTENLSQYADYHQDARNIATHFVGVPMIVLAVVILLSRPVFMLGGWPLTPAILMMLPVLVYYLRMDLRFGAVMVALFAVCAWVAAQTVACSTSAWLAWGVGLFGVGWAIQFIGHYCEGRKPAFVDDVIGLLIGPLFIVAEAAFGLGLRLEVRQAMRLGSTNANPLPSHTPTVV